MTWSANYTGEARNWPGLASIVSPAIDTLTDAEVEHIHHVDHIVEHFLDEHAHLGATVNVAGSAGDAGQLGVNIAISLAPLPVPAETQAALVDSPASTSEPTASEAPPTPSDAAPADGSSSLPSSPTASSDSTPPNGSVSAASETPSSAVSAETDTAAAPAAPVAPDAPAETQSVYLHLTEDAIDTAVWPASGTQTTDGKPLYHYSGDVAGALPPTTNGAAVEGWQLYSGPVEAIPAA